MIILDMSNALYYLVLTEPETQIFDHNKMSHCIISFSIPLIR